MSKSGQIVLCLAMWGLLVTAFAAPLDQTTDSSYLIAQNIQQPADAQGLPPPPQPSGTLLLPGVEQDNRDTAGKKCMTVCAQWGEECSYINRGTAGTTRSCRRSCQQFKEECF